jgi:hypothetical protein
MSQEEDVKDSQDSLENQPEVTVIVKQPKKPIADKPKREMTEKQKAAFEKMRSGLQKWREERPDYSERMRSLVQAEKTALEQRIKAETTLPPNAKVVIKSRRGRQPGTKLPNQGRHVFTPAQSEVDVESEVESTRSSEVTTTDADTDFEEERRRDRQRRKVAQKKKKQAADQVQEHLPALGRTRPANPMASYLNSLNGRF